MKRQLLQSHLKFLARLVIRRYQPHVIGITGSIGKTSAKEAVSTVLAKKFRLRASFKNYNNELGLPLTIIGEESAGRSLAGWLKIFIKAWGLIIFKERQYPEVLILEMGVDRPGDMTYLCSIATPEIGIATAVSYSHLEYFGSVANIKKEKQVLIEKVINKGLAVLNYDNEFTREMSEASHARVITYGLKEGADLQAQNIAYNFSQGDYELAGLHFKMSYGGSIVPVFMKNVLSEPAIYAGLAGAAVGLYFGMNLVEIAEQLNNFNSPVGRMNLIAGYNHSFLIDDTYNSSPEACLAALAVLDGVKITNESKKYAVLGDMLEIGNYTADGHRLVGEKVAASSIDYLVAVGEKGKLIGDGAAAAGFKTENIFYFPEAAAAGEFLKPRIKSGDVVLLKGSQGIRLEKATKCLLAEPEKAATLLVRQGNGWPD
jgi:UDP-N-acetylmuramoyl-tripeptide--D-alanyl-D-alanine ligase